MESRARQIYQRFVKFHMDNPRVWELFQRLAFDVLEAGFRRYAADAIFHRVRWEIDIVTRGDMVKLNNDYTAYYARMFAAVYPQYAGLFKLRKRTSAERQPYATDLSVIDNGPPEDEERLMESLQLLGTPRPSLEG